MTTLIGVLPKTSDEIVSNMGSHLITDIRKSELIGNSVTELLTLTIDDSVIIRFHRDTLVLFFDSDHMCEIDKSNFIEVVIT